MHRITLNSFCRVPSRLPQNSFGLATHNRVLVVNSVVRLPVNCQRQPNSGCQIGCQTAFTTELTTRTIVVVNSHRNTRVRAYARYVCVFGNRYYSSYGGNTYCLRNTICANADAYAFASVLPFARIPSGWWRIPPRHADSASASPQRSEFACGWRLFLATAEYILSPRDARRAGARPARMPTGRARMCVRRRPWSADWC